MLRLGIIHPVGRSEILLLNGRSTAATRHPPVLAVSGGVHITVNIVHEKIWAIVRDRHFKSGTSRDMNVLCITSILHHTTEYTSKLQ